MPAKRKKLAPAKRKRVVKKPASFKLPPAPLERNEPTSCAAWIEPSGERHWLYCGPDDVDEVDRSDSSGDNHADFARRLLDEEGAACSDEAEQAAEKPDFSDWGECAFWELLRRGWVRHRNYHTANGTVCDFTTWSLDKRSAGNAWVAASKLGLCDHIIIEQCNDQGCARREQFVKDSTSPAEQKLLDKFDGLVRRRRRRR